MVASMVSRTDAGPAVDAVTAEVIRSAMETVCFEMATFVSRTATTPILNQSNERNATILDWQGRLAALSVGIPQFMLSATLPIALRARVLRRGALPGRRDRRQRPVPRRRPPARLQRVLAGLRHPPRRARGAGAHRVDPVPPRRHRRRDGRWLQRVRQGHLVGGHAVPAPEDHRAGQGAPRRRAHDAGQQPASAASSATCAPQVGAAQLGVARLAEIIGRYGPDTVKAAVDFVDRGHPPPLHRRDRGVARRRLRGRRVRRLRPAGQPRHPRALQDHRRRRPPDRRLRGLRHAPGHPGVVDVRQHARLHHRAARVARRPVASRRTRASSTASTCACPSAAA